MASDAESSPQKDSESAAPNENIQDSASHPNMPTDPRMNLTKLSKETISTTHLGTSSQNPYLNTFSTALPSRTQLNFHSLHESQSSKRHRLQCKKPLQSPHQPPKKSSFNFSKAKSKDNKNPLQPHKLRVNQTKSIDKDCGKCLEYNYRIN